MTLDFKDKVALQYSAQSNCHSSWIMGKSSRQTWFLNYVIGHASLIPKGTEYPTEVVRCMEIRISKQDPSQVIRAMWVSRWGNGASLIRNMNAWCDRVGGERISWDEKRMVMKGECDALRSTV